MQFLEINIYFLTFYLRMTNDWHGDFENALSHVFGQNKLQWRIVILKKQCVVGFKASQKKTIYWQFLRKIKLLRFLTGKTNIGMSCILIFSKQSQDELYFLQNHQYNYMLYLFMFLGIYFLHIFNLLFYRHGHF